MQHAWEVEAGDDQPPEVGNKGNGRICLLGGKIDSPEQARYDWLMRCNVGRRVIRMLEGEVDVDECCDCLDRPALLSVVDKVTLAGLVFGVPLEAGDTD